MQKCELCGKEDTIVEHHVNYEKGITVPLCGSCHFKAHNDPDHELYPEDSKGSTAYLSQEVHDELKKLKFTLAAENRREFSISDTVLWLLKNTDELRTDQGGKT